MSFTDLVDISGGLYDQLGQHSAESVWSVASIAPKALEAFINACISHVTSRRVPMYQICRLLSHCLCLSKSPEISRLLQAVVHELSVIPDESNVLTSWLDVYEVSLVRLYKYLSAYAPEYDGVLKAVVQGVARRSLQAHGLLSHTSPVYSMLFIVETVKTAARLGLCEPYFLDLMVGKVLDLYKAGHTFSFMSLKDFMISLAELNYGSRFSPKIAYSHSTKQNFLSLTELFSNEIIKFTTGDLYEKDIEVLTDYDEEVELVVHEPWAHWCLPMLWTFAVFDYMCPAVFTLLRLAEDFPQVSSEEDFKKLAVLLIWLGTEKSYKALINAEATARLRAFQVAQAKKHTLPLELSPKVEEIAYSVVKLGVTPRPHFLEFPYLIDVAYRRGKVRTACLVLRPEDYLIQDGLVKVGSYLARRQLTAKGWQVEEEYTA
jgi:hypothetical protein